MIYKFVEKQFWKFEKSSFGKSEKQFGKSLLGSNSKIAFRAGENYRYL